MPPFHNEQFNDPPMDGSNDAATYFVLFIFVLICIIFIIYFCVIIWAFACCVADPPVHNGRRSAVRYDGPYDDYGERIDRGYGTYQDEYYLVYN